MRKRALTVDEMMGWRMNRGSKRKKQEIIMMCNLLLTFRGPRLNWQLL